MNLSLRKSIIIGLFFFLCLQMILTANTYFLLNKNEKSWQDHLQVGEWISIATEFQVLSAEYNRNNDEYYLDLIRDKLDLFMTKLNEFRQNNNYNNDNDIDDLFFSLQRVNDITSKIHNNSQNNLAKLQYIDYLETELQSISVLTNSIFKTRSLANYQNAHVGESNYKQKSLFLLFCLFIVMFLGASYVYKIITKLASDIRGLSLKNLDDRLDHSMLSDIQQIVDAVNSARTQLKYLTVSRSELEKEIEIRKLSEKKYQILADYSLSWEFWIDTQGEFQYVSPACEMISGYSAEEFLNKEIYFEKLLKETGLNLWNGLKDVKWLACNPDPASAIFSITSKNGVLVILEASCRLVRSNNQVLGVRGVFRDITLERALFDENENYKKELEHKVEARTKELEDALKDLEGFSYSVSHDLRAPLRAIDGFIQILLEDYGDKFDGEASRLFEIVSQNAKKMGQLIEDILAYSRAGRRELITKNIDVSKLVNSEKEVILQIPAYKNIAFDIGQLHPVSGDEVAIKQVFNNLISNAAKFTAHADNPEIRISSVINKISQCVEYKISDNGVGFDMAYADKLFVLFQRLHGMDEFEGTGVGLAIVKRFVEMHGGKVHVLSEVNHGTEFTIQLPMTL